MTSQTLEPALDSVLRREQLAEAIAGDRPCHGLRRNGCNGQESDGLGPNESGGPGPRVKTKGNEGDEALVHRM